MFGLASSPTTISITLKQLRQPKLDKATLHGVVSNSSRAESRCATKKEPAGKGEAQKV